MIARPAANAEPDSASHPSHEPRQPVTVEHATLDPRQSLMDLSIELAALRAAAPKPRKQQEGWSELKPAPGIELDSPTDTFWANPDPRFSRVVHVMHQGWHGIRAAASFLPGHKVAVPVGRRITAHEIQQLLRDHRRAIGGFSWVCREHR
jgi:hypothetical protein